ncbi:stage II sporulation protein D [Clostridium perfringens]|uniref:Stage II sporulation protein D n=1 Tax=Clostridium perfringens (strain 13 / Type A) TaxID=195102 RepID=Q8XID8_CLOPE|nr:stage II sporulation protein D [Clostridium perfringens]EHK2362812.1 stage II sporulation protein D [Clostridium perfringens]EIF6155627.1 stage II sporulation protein D [Clostridium perfringens]EJT5923553.1 stage II sporulation protein D [Clostridium perfringens]EJT5926531.1 stage II sporulation protein D [Clostridium perfringens]EJT6481317.1 stage II sporulation protein D [Clostridium perfringens]
MINRKILESVIFIVTIIVSIVFIPILFGFLSSSSMAESNNKVEKVKNKKLVDVVNLKEVEVYISKENKVEKVPLEEYVLSVVSSEMPATFHEEALKAQSILARTFVINKLITGCNNIKEGNICDTTHCQAYLNINERKKAWGKEGDEYLKKLKKVVKETEGKVLSYNDQLVKYPQYFSTSSGNTEDAVAVFSEDVPYLKSVQSPGEEISPKYESEISMSISDFKGKIKKSIPNSNLGNNINEEVKILSRNKGGTVDDIKIGDVTIKGKEFRKIFGLNSANFTLEVLEDKINIKCLGYGHGVGMSQWGANVMAKEGSKYDEILEHYFKGSKIEESNEVLIG